MPLEAHRPQIRRYLCIMIHNVTEAEDLRQEEQGLVHHDIPRTLVQGLLLGRRQISLAIEPVSAQDFCLLAQVTQDVRAIQECVFILWITGSCY